MVEREREREKEGEKRNIKNLYFFAKIKKCYKKNKNLDFLEMDAVGHLEN